MPIHQTGRLIYPQIFLGFMEPLDKIMENIGWLLRSTEQGMWKAQLQQAEETSGLGWLLFLADEFDKEALKSQIWETMGVHVVLRYWAIDDGVMKCDATNKKRVKALHIEVDKADPASSRNRNKCLYFIQKQNQMLILLGGHSLPLRHQDEDGKRTMPSHQYQHEGKSGACRLPNKGSSTTWIAASHGNSQH